MIFGSGGRRFRPLSMSAKATRCTIESPVCSGIARHGHHRARGSRRRLPQPKIPACPPCHDYIHANPDWARANGHVLPLGVDPADEVSTPLDT